METKNEELAIAHKLTHEELCDLPGLEMEEKRTVYSKTYDLGTGYYQTVLSSEPMHCINAEGELIEINHTLKEADDALIDESPDLQARFEAGGAVTLTKDGYSLSWTLADAQEALPEKTEPSKEERLPRQADDVVLHNEVRYQELFPGVDMRCRMTAGQFKDELCFNTPDAMRPLIWHLYAPGMKADVQKDGDITFSVEDQVIYTLPCPVLLDDDGMPVPDSAGMVLQQTSDDHWDWTVTMNPDAFPQGIKFPVTLDPVVKTSQTGTTMSMAYTQSGDPGNPHPATAKGYIAGSSTYGICHTYLKFDDASLPAIDASFYVTHADITFTRDTGNAGDIFVREVLDHWDAATLTWNSNQSVSQYPFDFRHVTTNNNEQYRYDITNLVRKWYNGHNYGLRLEKEGHTVTVNGPTSPYPPFAVIDYISLAGLEGYLQMDSHACGRAGTAYVGLFNGNLVLSHSETQMNGQLMPVSINRFYNSCYYNQNTFGVGNGWKLSAQQLLYKETIGTETYYVYMDGDGTKHHFKKVSGKWHDQSGLGLILTMTSSEATITDKGDNKMLFDLPTAEFSNNYGNAKMIKSVTDACGNVASFTFSSRVLTQATDGAGRVTTGTVSSSKLTALTAPGTPAVSYTYSGTKLTGITHADTEGTTYTYDNNGLLETIENPDQTGLKFIYYTHAPFRVQDVIYRNNGVEYGGRRYEYGDCRTTVTELIPASGGGLTTGKSLVYHFNDAGNAVSVNDELGYGCFTGYNDSFPLNHPEFVSRMQRSVDNYLKNHRFKTTDHWTYEALNSNTDSHGVVNDRVYIGQNSYKLTKSSSTGEQSVYQTLALTKGKTYTFSCHFQTDVQAIRVQLRAEYQDSAGATVTENSLARGAVGTWGRLSVSFYLPTNAASSNVKLRMVATAGAGTVWLDAAQLEDGPVMNRYNVLINSNFSSIENTRKPTDWAENSDIESVDGVYAAGSERPSSLSGNVLRLYGKDGTEKLYTQTFIHWGPKDDVYTFGGWLRAFSRQGSTGIVSMALYAKPRDEDAGVPNPSYREIAVLTWSREWSGWHFGAMPAVIPWRYTALQIRIKSLKQINFAEFSNVFLYKEEFGKSFGYDSNGNVTNATNLASMKSDATYDSFNNMLSYHQPGRVGDDKYTLDWGSTDADRKKHLLKKTTSPLGVITESTYYDDTGNPKTTLTRNSSSSMVIASKTEYTADSNYVAKQIDSRSKEVKTVTNPNTGTVTSVEDAGGQIVTYTYDAMKRNTGTSAVVGTMTYLSKSRYEDDQLVELSHNTTSNTIPATTSSSDTTVRYHFGFDSQKRPTTVSVGNQTLTTLSTNLYNTTPGSVYYGTLTGVNYGNGGKVRYTYDGYKRVIGVKFDNASVNRFVYDYGANGQIGRVTDRTLDRRITTNYDLANRPARSVITQSGQHLYSASVGYDDFNNLQYFMEKVGTNLSYYRTWFTYDTESKPILLNYSDGSSLAYTYDGIGRLLQRKLKFGNNTEYVTAYTYVTGSNGGNTTLLIAGMTQTGETCTYTYTSTGNIASVTRNGVTTNYTYDSIGQLIRVDDPSDPTSGSTGTTWTYTYDRGGNILTKKRYIHATGTLGTEKETTTYTYGNMDWKDQLTSYTVTVNGGSSTTHNFIYDDIGNPTNDGTWSYTWEHGRQLKSMTRISDSKVMNFEYNHDGIRVRKTFGNVTTNIYVHGNQVVHQSGSNGHYFHFFYDAQGRLAEIRYNGAAYGVIQNLQGDVIGLIDNTGTEVVRYVYDSWGKVLSVTGSMASTLGTWNPIRYRGYYYDVETGLYYLRSRYYNPEWDRFLNADSLFDSNLFSYCENNPLLNTDDDGTWGIPGLAWPGEIHEAVQNHIVEMSNGAIIKEVGILQFNGSFGRIDLLNTFTGEFWDVKPASLSIISIARQLARYTNPQEFLKEANKKYSKRLMPGTSITHGSFTYKGKLGITYTVNYLQTNPGVIRYIYTYSHVKIEEVAKAVATGLAAGVMGQSIINSGMDFGLSFGAGPSFNHWNRDQRLI